MLKKCIFVKFVYTYTYNFDTITNYHVHVLQIIYFVDYIIIIFCYYITFLKV